MESKQQIIRDQHDKAGKIFEIISTQIRLMDLYELPSFSNQRFLLVENLSNFLHLDPMN